MVTSEFSGNPAINILIVDDKPQNRLSLKSILQRSDYQVVEAASSNEALLHLLKQQFAVLLIDVVMPDTDGLSLASLIKQRERTANTPIIFLTAEPADVALIYRAYQAGAVDYLVKPVMPEVVRAKVEVFAQLYRQRCLVEKQAVALLHAERRENEMKLLELRMATDRRYRSMAEALPQIVWTASADGQIDYFNQRWFEYTQLPAGTHRGQWDVALHPDDVDRCYSLWTASVRTGDVFQVECRLKRGSDQTFRWHLCRAVPARDPLGTVTSWMGTFTDIDEQKQLQVERESLYRGALEAIGARDNFLSIASHELKTPLTSLQLQVDALIRMDKRGQVLPEKVTSKFTMASRQIERLVRLVNELLDVSRITSGRLELNLEEVELVELTREILARFTEDASKVNSSLVLQVGEEPLKGHWDRLRLEQVLTNLLSNALKFGAGQPIEVLVERDGHGVQMKVKDRGIGIKPQDARRIFERFERAVPSRAYGGLGLGLYIVRQIVEAHGGRIGVESGERIGSTFIVELPELPPSHAIDSAELIVAPSSRSESEHAQIHPGY